MVDYINVYILSDFISYWRLSWNCINHFVETIFICCLFDTISVLRDLYVDNRTCRIDCESYLAYIWFIYWRYCAALLGFNGLFYCKNTSYCQTILAEENKCDEQSLLTTWSWMSVVFAVFICIKKTFLFAVFI